MVNDNMISPRGCGQSWTSTFLIPMQYGKPWRALRHGLGGPRNGQDQDGKGSYPLAPDSVVGIATHAAGHPIPGPPLPSEPRRGG
jgi:hypothetical protein